MSELVEKNPFGLKRWLPAYAENRRLLGYVFVVFATALFLLIWHGGRGSAVVTVPFLAWFVFNFVAELLWLETGTGEGTDSMAMTMNFAVIMLFDPTLYLWVIGVSVLLATRFIQKRDWFRAIFGLGQMVITAFVAGLLFRMVQGGPTLILEGIALRPVLAMVLCGAAYFFTNTFLVAGAVSLERRLPFWATWRHNWGYRNSIISSVALFSLAPLLILAYLSVSYPGVLLFFLPLFIIKNQNREYINLQKATEQLVSTERFAAKGEMAAQVAHEINNYLAVLNGRAQLLIARATKIDDEAMKADAEVIRQQVAHMSTLAKGLLEFSHQGIRIQRFDLNEQIVKWVDFVKPQNTYDGIALDCELQPDLGEVDADGGALQQVLINLLKNAADAIRGQEDRASDDPPRILVRTAKHRKDRIRIRVSDNGPGMPPAVQAKVFEPAFTTKKHGHGFGLSTCYKIMKNHQGKLWVESTAGKGTVFFMELPRRAEAGLSEGKGSAGAESDRDQNVAPQPKKVVEEIEPSVPQVETPAAVPRLDSDAPKIDALARSQELKRRLAAKRSKDSTETGSSGSTQGRQGAA